MMDKVAHILVCHSIDPHKLLQSIPHDENAMWFVFFHGSDGHLAFSIEKEMAARNGVLLRYDRNRGLARSWNEGLRLAQICGCSIQLLLNDDLFFYPEGYRSFLETIKAVREISNNVSFITVNGLESGKSPFAGKVIAQSFACCAVTSDAIQKIGYFDENFVPAYFEDVDYARRSALAGMTWHLDERTLVEHERSSTTRISEDVKSQYSRFFSKNSDYYIRKWGGLDSEAHFVHPFNSSQHSHSISYADRAKPYGLGFDRLAEEITA